MVAQRRKVNGLWLAAFVVLGLPTGALGVAWPSMRASLHAPLAGLGLLLVVATGGYFITTSVTGRLLDRLGTDALLIAASAVVGVGLVIFALAPAWWLALLAGALLGAGSGPLDAGVNSLVAVNRGVRMMGWLHASWGFGAALGPPLVVASNALGSWRLAFGVMALAFATIGMAGFVLRSDLRTERPVDRIRRPVGGAITVSLVPLLALFFLQFGLEAATGQWPYSQLTARALPSPTAGWGMSLYWAALTSGRVALGVAGHRFRPQVLLDAGVVVAIIGAVAYWVLPPLGGALLALPLIGLGLSVVVPLIINRVPAQFGPARAAYAIGYMSAAGTVGAALLPAATGVALQWLGPGSLGPALSAFALSLAGLSVFSRQRHDD
jgi:MFS family permease